MNDLFPVRLISGRQSDDHTCRDPVVPAPGTDAVPKRPLRICHRYLERRMYICGASWPETPLPWKGTVLLQYYTNVLKCPLRMPEARKPS